MFPCIPSIYNRQPIETQSRLVVVSGWGGEECGVTAKRCRMSFWGDGEILELVVILIQLCIYTNNH